MLPTPQLIIYVQLHLPDKDLQWFLPFMFTKLRVKSSALNLLNVRKVNAANRMNNVKRSFF